MGWSAKEDECYMDEVADAEVVWECCSGDAVYELSIMMHLELDCVPPPFT